MEEQIKTSVQPKLAKWVVLSLLTLIVLAGGYLRFHLLGYRGLWNDEVVSIRYWSGSISDVFRNVATLDIHPPFWFLTVNLASRLGETDFNFRLPSAIAGTLSLVFIFLLGKSLFNKWTALVATLLLSVTSFHIYHSQEARMYAVLMCLSLLSTLFLWEAIEKDKKAFWWGFLLATILNVYTHYFAFQLIAGQAVYVGVRLFFEWITAVRMKGASSEKTGAPAGWMAVSARLIPFLICLAIVALLYLPWLAEFKKDLSALGGRVSTVNLSFSIKSIWQNINFLLEHFTGYLPALSVWNYLFLLLAFVWMLLLRQFPQLLLTGSILAVPLMFNAITHTQSHPRYFIYLLPVVLLLIAKGITGIGEVFSGLYSSLANRIPILNKRSLAGALLFLAILISAAGLAKYLSVYQEQLFTYYEYEMLGSWREIGEFLNKNVQPGDAVFTERAVTLVRYFDNEQHVPVYHGDQAENNFTLAELQSAYQDYKRVWVVMPRNVWNISPETKKETVAWLRTLPYVQYDFLGHDFPGAVVFMVVESAKTQKDILSMVKEEVEIPLQPVINLSLARQFESQGMFPETLGEYQKVLALSEIRRLNPGYVNRGTVISIRQSIADMWMQQGNVKQAIEEYEQAAALGERSFQLYKNLFKAYSAIGDVESAQKYEQLLSQLSVESGLGIYLDIEPMAAAYHGGVRLGDDNTLGMYWVGAGSAVYSIPTGVYTIRVQARGDQGCGMWPVLSVQVDGNEVGSQEVSNSKYGIYEFRGVLIEQTGEHTIVLAFVQPGACEKPGQDVNLYLNGLYLERTGDAAIGQSSREFVNLKYGRIMPA